MRFDRETRLIYIYKIQGRIYNFEKLGDEIDRYIQI